jgi:C-terminal processing protease CtpA/Prc
MRTLPWTLVMCFTFIVFLASCQVSPTPVPTTGCAPCPTAAALPGVDVFAPTRIPTGTPVPTSAPTQTIVPAPTQTPWVVYVAPQASQPVQVTGNFKYTNDFVVETYYLEHAVSLVDMHGFVIRNKNWEIPARGQALGLLKIDPTKKIGTFKLDLPARPSGTLNDLDHNGRKDAGVQVFVVSYWPNLAGGPFSEGDDRSFGWPDYLTSVITDSDNQDEVIGGRLIVWAPDDRQSFPSGFGADGLLFTSDDPVAPLPAGYTMIDLGSKPFNLVRDAELEMVLYEPKDIAIKDYSKSSFSQAFLNMFAQARKQYAFNGIKGKQPDWEKLLAAVEPGVRAAEAKNDAKAYYLALQQFILAFNDGHVSLQGGTIAAEMLREKVSSGYGMALRELDDGKVIVIYITKSGSADRAGIKVGAEIKEFNGLPIKTAISAISLESPQSTDFGRRYQQTRYLMRAPVGTEADITYQNPDGAAVRTSIKAVRETESFSYTSIYRGYDPDALPVVFEIRSGGMGYVRINSNYDDLNLIIRLFERSLKTFTQNEVKGIIIDLRMNSGGSPLGLAGFLTDREISLGQLEYFSEKTNRFEPEGERQRVLPMENQYRFKKMVLLVGQACFSACEIEAYGFSQVPGMVVMGQYPTGGVEAEVARGEFHLPGDQTIVIPTGRFTLPDGSIFLEGKGVQPTIRVPINSENVLSREDVVLQTAEKELAK